MESHTEVGGVLTRLTSALAVGVPERLVYIVATPALAVWEAERLGYFVLTSAFAIGVAERLGYIVLARESGRGGEEARAAFLEA
jgi:hypothetical protein